MLTSKTSNEKKWGVVTNGINYNKTYIFHDALFYNYGDYTFQSLSNTKMPAY